MSISIFGSVKGPDVSNSNGRIFLDTTIGHFRVILANFAWLLLSDEFLLRHKSFEFGNGVLEIFLLCSFVLLRCTAVHRYADAYLSSCCSARDSRKGKGKRSKARHRKATGGSFAKTMF
jgi:hypothetical protein